MNNSLDSFFNSLGQVYVMVPTPSNLFANPETLIGTLVHCDKAASLVEVPAGGSSAFLGQQVCLLTLAVFKNL